MRTADQILERVKKKAPSDLFGACIDLLVYLPFEMAKPFLNDAVTAEEWAAEIKTLTREGVVDEMKGYMPFAWEKATGHRGISAGRSLQHFEHWLWLLEDDAALSFLLDDDNYQPYGVPVLMDICRRYSFSHPDDDEALRMASGKPCRTDCRKGCSL